MKEDFSKNDINYILKKLKLSQAALARELGVQSQTTIYRWVVGKTHPRGAVLGPLNILWQKAHEL